MTKVAYRPQHDEIVKALMAAGCGIRRRTLEQVAPAKPAQQSPPRIAASRHAPPPPDMADVIASSPATADGAPSLQTLLLAASIVYRIPVQDLKSARRKKDVVRARQAYFWLARMMTPHSLPTIGRFVAGKDHSTVLHAINKVETRRDLFEPELSQILAKLQKDDAQ